MTPPRPTDPLAVGIDVGGSKIQAVGIDPANPAVIVSQARVPTPKGADALVGAIESLTLELTPAPTSIGLGLAGLVDRAGRYRYGANIPGVLDISLPDRLAHLCDTVVADNDSTCAAWGEFRVGAGAGAADGVFLGLGSGLGAGFVSNGMLVRGSEGFAGEAGHMIVVADGELCSCGRRGCWERYTSGAALGRLAATQLQAGRGKAYLALAGPGQPVRGEHVTAAFIAGDPDAVEAISSLARWTALGLSNLINLMDPRIVVLGGGVVEPLGGAFCQQVQELLPQFLMGAEFRTPVVVKPAVLGNKAGAIGAALLGIDRVGGVDLLPT